MTSELLAKWTARANALEPYAPNVAHVLRECVQELSEAQRAEDIDSVSLAEAAILSGYTSKGLGGMIRRGEIENVGNKRRPRIRRRDIPKRPGYRAQGVDFAVLALDAGSARRRIG